MQRMEVTTEAFRSRCSRTAIAPTTSDDVIATWPEKLENDERLTGELNRWPADCQRVDCLFASSLEYSFCQKIDDTIRQSELPKGTGCRLFRGLHVLFSDFAKRQLGLN